MPATLSYPGVYIQEISSGVRTITGVATSITAFVGRASRGPTNESVSINSYGDFERIFGGLWTESSLGYAVRDFYLNGGSRAIIVRLYHSKFASADERDKAAKAATDTAAKATGTDAAAAAAGAKTQANTYLTEPEKTTAQSVAEAANQAAAAAGATPADVKKAADIAAAGAAPLNKASLTLSGLNLEALYEGNWGANLRFEIDTQISEQVAKLMKLPKEKLFNLTVRELGPSGLPVRTEQFRNVSFEKNSARQLDKVLEAESNLVRWKGVWPPISLPDLAEIHTAEAKLAAEQAAPLPATSNPAKDKFEKILAAQQLLAKLTTDSLTQAEQQLADAQVKLAAAQAASPQVTATIDAALADVKTAIQAHAEANAKIKASDGAYLVVNDFTGPGKESAKEGIYALEKADLFNILCIPPYVESGDDVDYNTLVGQAAKYCEDRRAMLLVDPPVAWNDKDKAKAGVASIGTNSKNAALFFPRLRQADPLRDNQIADFAPCGAIAGVFARTDTTRGVWKAPAGLDATLVGVQQLSVPLTDAENGELNPLGINCLRAMPAAGRIVWGSRTLQGDDRLASEWKYIPVRRTALFIEESLYRGTQWVVFEPNDEPLWAQIRLNLGAFMHGLFRQGAFQGKTPQEAYFVKCDKETTTQTDINLGIVNILVGFAPLKPTEFVVITFQQMAGQIQT